MALALYRKYRPQKFAEVNGQNHIKLTLQNELKNQMIGHAYLFCGPRGTGKTTMARLMAKAVNCLNLAKNGEPCNECDSCKNFSAAKLMDIIEIDAASHTGVDNVRDNIINNARFTPSISRYKVFIIDEVHMLSISAFNALLKLLEEPPAHVIFILATTEIHKVPLTIISRCQRFDFQRVAFRNLVERLQYVVNRENVKVDRQVLELVARQANGCVRDAESLLDQILSLGEKEIGIDEASLIIPKSNFDSLNNLLKFLVQKDARQAVESVNQLVVDGVDIQQFVNEFIDFCRRGLLYKIKNSLQDLAEDVGEDRIGKVVELLDGIEISALVKIIRYFLRAKEELKLSPILQLPIEIAIIEIAQPAGVGVLQQISKAPKPQDSVESLSVQTGNGLEKNNKSDSVDLSNIQARWPAFLQFLKNKNYSLSISLSVGFPMKVESGVLVIGFLFGLQKDRIDNLTGTKLVQEKIKEFFGVDISIRCVVDSMARSSSMNGKNATNSEQAVNGALEAFGGEIIA